MMPVVKEEREAPLWIHGSCVDSKAGLDSRSAVPFQDEVGARITSVGGGFVGLFFVRICDGRFGLLRRREEFQGKD